MTMRRDDRLLFGVLSSLILLGGIAGFAQLVPGYSSVRQTVSEIGEIGSPVRSAFAAMLFCVAACTLIFARAVRAAATRAARPGWPALLIGFMAVPLVGIGVFAFPHPLHNVFGMSELLAYQAPAAVAIVWRGAPRGKSVAQFSWILYALLWLVLALNLGTLARHSAFWLYERPVYGLVQRSLFFTWCVWCAGLGWMLWRRSAVKASTE